LHKVSQVISYLKIVFRFRKWALEIAIFELLFRDIEGVLGEWRYSSTHSWPWH